jgi:hypothetical protein
MNWLHAVVGAWVVVTPIVLVATIALLGMNRTEEG